MYLYLDNPKMAIVRYEWMAIGATPTVSNATLSQANFGTALMGSKLVQATTIPDAMATPATDYDIVLENRLGEDMASDGLKDRSASDTETVTLSSYYIGGDIAIKVTNATNASCKGILELLFIK